MMGPDMEAVPGFWPGSLSAREAVCAMADFVELKASAAGAIWSLHEPATGQTLLWQAAVGETPRCLTPPGFSVRSRVNEYGGGSFAVANDCLVFVNESDQQLYVQQLDTPESMPIALTQRPECRYADMDIAPCGSYLLAVEEEHGQAGVVHRLVRVPLGRAVGDSPATLHEGEDFYSSPRISADGQRMLWVSWQRPDQPWTKTRLLCAASDGLGGWQAPMVLAGDCGEAAIQQPAFDPFGNAVALNDRLGFWQPWREQAGRLQLLPGISADHAGAPWQMGGCNFLVLDRRYVLASWFEQGFGRLGLYDLDEKRVVARYLADYSRIRHLAQDEGFFYCIASRLDGGSRVLAIRREDSSVHCLAQLDTGVAAVHTSAPQALEFATTENGRAHAFFYPPYHPRYRLESGQRPPLVIFLHGGPTSAAYPVFDARIQFWTQRGFAVADLNYRGSTGFGRAYRQSLAGRWGELDVADVLALVDELVARDWVEPRHIFVRGASAGGYTSLLALAKSADFTAAASWYGVSDPLALNKVTHKFESDYLAWLLGPLSESNRRSIMQRSPVAQATSIQAPVVFFQGGQDIVVVPEQTRSMVRQLQQQGVQVECYEFPEQGHGFRCVERLEFALQAELAFYQRQLRARG